MGQNEKTGKELKQKIDIALLYTNGDLELAKKIVNGNYQDIMVLKARFKEESSSTYGLYFLSFANELKSLVGIHICVGKSPSIYNNKPFEPWFSFETTISKELTQGPDTSSTNKLKEILQNKLDQFNAESILTFIKGDNFPALNSLFQGLIEKSLGIEGVASQIEIEKITSIDFFDKSTSRFPIEDEEEEEIEFSDGSSPHADNVIIKGNFILSPVKGKFINKLEEGESVKILIAEKTKKAINIASKLNAYEDGTMKPIIGEIDSYRKLGELHEVYVTIAPYILVRIAEEENVKVATVRSAFEDAEQKTSKRSTIIALGVIFIVVLILIIYMYSSS